MHLARAPGPSSTHARKAIRPHSALFVAAYHLKGNHEDAVSLRATPSDLAEGNPQRGKLVAKSTIHSARRPQKCQLQHATCANMATEHA